MRILWVSNAPWSNSGYGQQTGIFLPRIQALGHELSCLAYFGLEGGVLNLNGILCYPKRYHPYGNDIALYHAQNFRADVMISLMDVWVLNSEDYPPQFKWAAWYPVDHDPMPAIVRQKLNKAWKRLSISKFGATKTHEAGMDCLYVPHGINTKVFCPGDKAEARRRLDWPNDRYIVLTVAMNKGNPSRKNFPEMMEAYNAFRRVHKDAMYFMQTDRGEGVNDMVNLPEMIRNLGMIEGQDVYFCNQYQNSIGFPPEYMADLYRAADVFLLVSAGEGFGIPILEAQACGCPVITSGWTANEELCFAGHTIDKKDALPFYSALASYQFKPDPRAIELALHAEYKHPTPTGKAVEIAQAEYDADAVMEKYWKPALAEMEAGL